jgi:hypothetical protein
MEGREREYRKLPGLGGSRRGYLASVVATRNRLWLGRDHLLAIESQGVSENYKRFYFSDIQALVVRRTMRAMVWSIILAVLAGGFTMLGTGLLWDGETEGALAVLIIAGGLLLGLVVNAAMGPSCVCHMRTAVQTEELPSLKRIRTARRVLRIIRPHIEGAQGRIDPETLAGEVSAGVAKAVAAAGRSASPPPVPSETTARLYRGGTYRVLFGLLLLDGMLTAIGLVSYGLALVFLSMLLTAGLAVSTILALVWGYRAGASSSLKLLSWISAAYVLVSILFGYVRMIAVAVFEPEIANNQWLLLKAIATQPSYGSIPMLVVRGAFAAAALSTGLFVLMRLREQEAALPPSSSGEGK